MDLQLSDKAALVSGGASGIGQAIATALCREGVAVAIVDRNAQRAEAWERGEKGQRRLAIAGDLTDDGVCRAAVRETLERFGALDILINNAGVNDGAGLGAGPVAFQASIAANLSHVYALAHHAQAALIESRGCIVNIGSKVSVTGQGGTSGYAAAKGAVNALTREWAVELAPVGVRVNAVLPAEVWTPLYEQWLADHPDPAAAKARIEAQIPLGQRFTTPDEIAAAAVFLASPRAGHTTGQLHFVDGGYTHLKAVHLSPPPQRFQIVPDAH